MLISVPISMDLLRGKDSLAWMMVQARSWAMLISISWWDICVFVMSRYLPYISRRSVASTVRNSSMLTRWMLCTVLRKERVWAWCEWEGGQISKVWMQESWRLRTSVEPLSWLNSRDIKSKRIPSSFKKNPSQSRGKDQSRIYLMLLVWFVPSESANQPPPLRKQYKHHVKRLQPDSSCDSGGRECHATRRRWWWLHRVRKSEFMRLCLLWS